jgi:hypothetical protein
MALDTARFPYARLVDAAHRLPFNGRLFGDNQEIPGFERVDMWDGHTYFLLAHKSIELAEPPAKAEPEILAAS